MIDVRFGIFMPRLSGSELARARWNSPDADRDQPRRAGELGGRPITCDCGTCRKCERRQRRNGLFRSLFTQIKFEREA
jgi:hypothetical protein